MLLGFGFGLRPEALELVGGHGLELFGAAAGALHGGEAGAELGVAAAQGGLGVDVEMAGEVHGGEEQVAELGFDFVGVGAGDLGVELGGFFGEFIEEAVGAGPVETNLRGAGA